MNEKISSAFDGLKDMAENAHIKEKISKAGETVKETISQIDVQETAKEVGEKFKHGGIKEAAQDVSEKIKDVASKATSAVKQSLRDNPGAAIDSGDDDAVNPSLVKERTCTLNNNPRNDDM